MKNFNQLMPVLPYILITGLVFFLLPVLSVNSRLLMLILFIPIYCLSSSVYYGFKNGFHWFYPIFVALMFLPIIFTLLKFSAIIIVLIYGVISLLGVFLGNQIAKKRHQ